MDWWLDFYFTVIKNGNASFVKRVQRGRTKSKAGATRRSVEGQKVSLSQRSLTRSVEALLLNVYSWAWRRNVQRTLFTFPSSLFLTCQSFERLQLRTLCILRLEYKRTTSWNVCHVNTNFKGFAERFFHHTLRKQPFKHLLLFQYTPKSKLFGTIYCYTLNLMKRFRWKQHDDNELMT